MKTMMITITLMVMHSWKIDEAFDTECTDVSCLILEFSVKWGVGRVINIMVGQSVPQNIPGNKMG